MKKPMKKTIGKRTKRFGTGGETTNPDENAAGSQVKFSKAQESWLEGADRTDPFILARMRKAVPDEVKTETTPAKTESVKAESAEPAKTTPVKLASNINPEDGKEYTPVDQAAPYKNSSLVSEFKPKPAKSTSSSSSNSGSNRPSPTFTVNRADDKTNMAKAMKDEILNSSKPDTKADTKNPYDSNAANAAIKAQANLDSAYTPSRAKPKTLQEKRDTREARRKAIDAKTSGMASKDRDAMRKGGSVKKMAGGGKVKSASARADGCAIRGKTRA